MIGLLPDLSAKLAELHPNKVGLVDQAGELRLTYAEIDRRASRAAAVLTQSGVGPGDRIALLARNRVEFFELLFAAGKLGAILAPLNWRMPAAELAPIVADCAPKLLFHGREDADAATGAAGGAPMLDLDDDGRFGFTAMREAAAAHPGREWWPAEETWVLLYTSGTTGAPKAVIHTHAMAWVNYINISQPVGITGADRTLCFLPLFHAGGIGLHALPTLMAGGEVRVLAGFDADLVMSLIEAGEVDTFFGVPAVYQDLCAHPRFSNLSLDRVRHWGSGGAALPVEIVRAFADRGAALCQGMGMTETGPTAFLLDQASAAAKPGSVGKPRAMMRARVMCGARPATPGEVGELQFAGPGVTPGYWNRPDSTRAAFTEDGWLRTGDLARRDDDGDYWIAGRSKDMFISGGENVYPAEVEAALAAHPSISEVCVVGAADARWGEVGVAHLVLRSGAGFEEAALRAWCRERLAGYKVPKAFVVHESLPKNALGKVQKHLLTQASAA